MVLNQEAVQDLQISLGKPLHRVACFQSSLRSNRLVHVQPELLLNMVPHLGWLGAPLLDLGRITRENAPAIHVLFDLVGQVNSELLADGVLFVLL